jgi:hypothetical protein
MENNPLRQYFRRPAVYLKLPSGGNDYGPDVIDMPATGELPVYPMTAIDEITSRTPDALFNGSALVELVKSCIPSIKDPWSINSSDIDAVLISLKAASGDGILDLSTTCPECKEENTYGVNLLAMLTTLKAADYSIPVEVRDLKIKFRPLTYKEINTAALEQFEIQKAFAAIDAIKDDAEKEKAGRDTLEKITTLTMGLVANTIQYIQTPETIVEEQDFILDFLMNCDRNTYTSIRELNTEMKTATEIKPLDIKCSSCDHEYQQPFALNPSDFFV